MLLNIHIGDKVIFKSHGTSIKEHFHIWARKLLKPGMELTIRTFPSNNGFCIATDPEGNIYHLNVITDELQRIKRG